MSKLAHGQNVDMDTQAPVPKKRKMKPAFTPTYNGPSKKEILDARKMHLSDGQYTFYKVCT